MSHYFLGVILPEGTHLSEVRPVLEMLLAPFDERIEVPPYKQRLVAEYIEPMTKRYNCDPSDLSTYVPNLPDWTGLDGGVDEVGLFLWTRYNPRSRWDWWEVGGRWDGVVTGEEDRGQPEVSSPRAPNHTIRLLRNMVRVRGLASGADFFALLTPDGEWYERGRMGWFAFVRDEKPEREWAAIRAEILSAYPQHHIVGLDCHI